MTSTIHLSHPMVSATVGSKAAVLLLLTPFECGVFVLGPCSKCAVILQRKAGCLTFSVFLLSRGCLCSVSHTRGVMDWSTVCCWETSWLFSLAFNLYYIIGVWYSLLATTVVPTKSDSDVIFCLRLLSKTLTCTLHLSLRKSIDHLCFTPIRRIGLIHKLSIDYKSLITSLTKHDVTVTIG